ncbi:MAG: hypothetical protein MUC63_09255, partial [Planctomycetes bacterium]|nr:hypothetical protein [Planctomycetota bacterium]
MKNALLVRAAAACALLAAAGAACIRTDKDRDATGPAPGGAPSAGREPRPPDGRPPAPSATTAAPAPAGAPASGGGARRAASPAAEAVAQGPWGPVPRKLVPMTRPAGERPTPVRVFGNVTAEEGGAPVVSAKIRAWFDGL